MPIDSRSINEKLAEKSMAEEIADRIKALQEENQQIIDQEKMDNSPPNRDSRAKTSLSLVLADLRECKPNDRSEKDRRYAVTITMLEQAYAYFHTYINDQSNIPSLS